MAIINILYTQRRVFGLIESNIHNINPKTCLFIFKGGRKNVFIS